MQEKRGVNLSFLRICCLYYTIEGAIYLYNNITYPHLMCLTTCAIKYILIVRCSFSIFSFLIQVILQYIDSHAQLAII